MLPRIEAATAPARSGRDELKAAVRWFADNPDFDDAHATEEYLTTSDAPVLVPSVIKSSDEAAKFIRSRVGKYFEEELRRYVQEARELEETEE